MDPHSRAPKKNTATEMRCYRKILHISYKDHVTDEEVRAKIQQATGPHEDLLTIVKRRKLQWYGHVSRSSDLAKTILQGTVKGGRRQGRQRKRWKDIREWTGLEFAKSQRAMENRGKWRKLAAKSSVVPNDPRGSGIDDDDNECSSGCGFIFQSGTFCNARMKCVHFLLLSPSLVVSNM